MKTVLVYHGSPYKFDNFSFENTGKNGGTSGAGFGLYFSQSKGDALTYGDNIYTCMLQLRDELYNTKINLSPEKLRIIIDSLNSEFNQDYFKQYAIQDTDKAEFRRKAICNELINGGYHLSDTEIIGDIINACCAGDPTNIMTILSKYDITHTTDNESPEDDTITHFIVYDLNTILIQNIENLNLPKV